MAFLGQEEELRELQDRFRFINFAIGGAIFAIVSRLLFLQLINGDRMRAYSEENRIKKVSIEAPRGMIFDRNRTLLVDNRPSFDLEITPQYFFEAPNYNQTIKSISNIIKMPEAQIRQKLEAAKRQQPFLPIKIKTGLSRDEVAMLETWKLDMPGTSVEMKIERTNIYGDVASHLLGYIAPVNSTELPTLKKARKGYSLGDKIGKFGIEKEFEESIRGVDGQELIEVDAMGRRLQEQRQNRFLSHDQEKPARPGDNYILTIDQDLQLTAAEAFGSRAGGLVALDPNNGKILSMISRPSFDPTAFSRGIDPETWSKLVNDENLPLRDKTIQDHYSPGSTFKLVTAIAGLEEGVITPTSKFSCSGSMQVGNRVYHCHKKGGHGEVDVVEAITQSCDVFFYRTALKFKSVDDISRWAFLLGLGKTTGIELSREVPGLIPTESWKLQATNQVWQKGESLNVAIGQSFVLTTVLQLTNLFAAIGNGGTLYRPYFVETVEPFDGSKPRIFTSKLLTNVKLQPTTIETIHKGLIGVVNSPRGTAFWQRSPQVEIAGKTGTSQVIRIAADKIYQKCENMKYSQRHHAIFAGFAPPDKPVIAAAAIVEHACHGSSGAAPVVRAVIMKYLEKYHPELLKTKIAAKTITIPAGTGDIE